MLDDETAINVLNSSKELSEDIKEKQRVAETTEAQIDLTRNKYESVAKHAQIMFFCTQDLAGIDPMYQYSLNWFVSLYISSISRSEKSSDLEERLKNLNNYFTYSLYVNVCRSLFERHKMLFAFLLTCRILQGKGKIDEREWYFLLTGGISLESAMDNPTQGVLSDKQWGELCRLSALQVFDNIHLHIAQNLDLWLDILKGEDIRLIPLPAAWRHRLTPFQRLLILRCLRPDSLVQACEDFVSAKLGEEFTTTPAFDLASCFKESAPHTPLVFILSPGSDPMVMLLKFAEMSGRRVEPISLGQGQGDIAKALIEKAKMEGFWVVLQNCHLASSWMPVLEKICDSLGSENVHPYFRLWCTSYPSPIFPVSILMNGIKMINESPRGMKSNIIRSLMSDPISDPQFFQCGGQGAKANEWRRLLFSLCFFHALVQQRRTFGPLGWNIPYEFNESDLRISVKQLHMLLEADKEIPFECLVYLTGECNYGGRVTDDKDRRLLMTLMRKYYSSVVLRSDFVLSADSSESFGFIMPKGDSSYESMLTGIEQFPREEPPRLFGLHDNAAITKAQNDANELLDTILLAQGSSDSNDNNSREEIVCRVAQDILSKV